MSRRWHGDHHRRAALAVGVDVERAEPSRQIEVHLRGAALPVAADGIPEDILELGAIERALARVDAGLHLATGLGRNPLQHRHHGFLGAIPLLVGADALLGPGRQLHDHLLEAEIAVDGHDEIVDLQALVRDLILRAEDVRVVLREAAHAQEPVQRARRLITMYAAELGEPVRQLAIGPQPVLVDLDMARSVHRLDRELALILRGGEHVLAEGLPVAGVSTGSCRGFARVHLAIADRPGDGACSSRGS